MYVKGVAIIHPKLQTETVVQSIVTRIPVPDRTSLYSCPMDKTGIRIEICTIFSKFLGRSVGFVCGEMDQKILTIFRMLALNFNVSSLSWLTVHYCWDTLSASHHT